MDAILKALPKLLKGVVSPRGLVIVLVLLALAVALFAWLKKRKAAAAADGGGGAPAPGKLPKLDLRAIWKAFLRNAPYANRRAIPIFQPVIVLGAAGSGKTSLIERYTDWRGQAAQFYPSYVDDPLLQIYQGRKVVVQELSPALLADPSERVRKALEKLWKPLRRGKSPKVVVVLNGARLQSTSPDALIRDAQMIRGKINVLASLLNAPVETRVVLTHMDQVEGCLVLSDLLRERGSGMRLLVGEGQPSLSDQLGQYEAFLPLVLTARAGRDYLRALTFLDSAATLVQPLEAFLEALAAPDAISDAPDLVDVTLESAQDAECLEHSPFTAHITAEEARRFRPQRRHQWAAVAIAVGGVVYLSAGFRHEKHSVAEANRLLTSFLARPSNVSARDDFFRYLHDRRASVARWLLPSYRADDAVFIEDEIRHRFLEGVRERILLPKLAQYDEGQGVKGLYLLALLYASEHGALGQFVLENKHEWASELSIPPQLIEDYVTANVSQGITPPLDDAEFAQRFELALVASLPDAPKLLLAVESALQSGLITPDALREMKQSVAKIRQGIAGIARTEIVVHISELLKDETGLQFAANWRERLDSSPRFDAAQLDAVLSMIEDSELAYPAPSTLDLAALVATVERVATPLLPTTAAPAEEAAGTTGKADGAPGAAPAAASAPPAADAADAAPASDSVPADGVAASPPVADPDYRFRVTGREVSISVAAWRDLIVRSAIVSMLDDFRAQDRDFESVLFASTKGYRDVVLNARRDGSSYFSGKIRIPGIYTAQAFDDKLKTPLVKLDSLLDRLPIPAEPRDLFREYVSLQIEAYATEYVAQYRSFYAAFGYRSSTGASLRYLLAQLQLPSSPLRAMLRDMVRNTSLDVPEDSLLLEPLLQVPSTFAFLRAMSPQPGGDIPALADYLAILGKMQVDLEEPQAGAAKADGAPAEAVGVAALKQQLSPLGGIALAIYRNDDDSYRRQVDAWLGGLNIRSEWAHPFTGPIDIGYAIGRVELESAVATSWADLKSQYVEPLGRLFPFERDAETVAAVDVMERSLNPTNAFWTAFGNEIAPLLTQQRGAWQERNGRFRPIALPPDLLATVNNMQAIAAALWDAEGKPKPLTVDVRALSLPITPSGAYRMLTSYLQVGGSTVFGFNQRPDWISVPIEWWKAEAASVGAAYSTGSTAARVYRSLGVANTQWSFYRLLQRGRLTDSSSGTWTWQVAAPDSGKATVRFEIEGDPWALFVL